MNRMRLLDWRIVYLPKSRAARSLLFQMRCRARSGRAIQCAALLCICRRHTSALRSGPLRILVVGGSLGAAALNAIVPRALALLPRDALPSVVHQSGVQHLYALRAHYAAAGFSPDAENANIDLIPF